ncbi:MAG: PspC domain-containing protein [Candidatus Limnocylindrales bacterium]
MSVNDRLYRSATDRVFTGLCGGLADHFDVDATLIRILWVVLGILSGIFPLLAVYVVMALLVPEEPVPGPWPGWGTPPWSAETSAPGAGPGPLPGEANGPHPAAPGSEAAGWPAEPGPVAGGPGTQPGAGTGPAAGAGVPGQSAGAWGPWGPPPPPGTDWRTARAYARAQRRAERAYWRSQRWGGDASSAGLVFGLILVLLGGIFLLQQTVPGLDMALFWPAALIVIGVLLLVGAFRR